MLQLGQCKFCHPKKQTHKLYLLSERKVITLLFSAQTIGGRFDRLKVTRIRLHSTASSKGDMFVFCSHYALSLLSVFITLV